ncbi:uncharacterized protein LOC114526973 isoform X2 [Dendronephthya gigantea]|nr:uncharacterized protein LOC114526973 isoform X2 [Dendronephthya gigantea]
MPIVLPNAPPQQVKDNTTAAKTKRGFSVIELDDFKLQIKPGCLAEHTEITLTSIEQKCDFKSLVDLGLVADAPRVVQFLPNGLKFLKPANLSIRLKKSLFHFEPFVLHGFYNDVYQKVVWELVTNDVTDSHEEQLVNVKINGFSFFSYILAKRGRLARILSHVNRSFTCCAYVLYQSQGLFADTIDIAVVMVSEFVEDKKEEDIKQLKDHFKEGYKRGEKGMLKRIHTDRRLVLRLDFSGVANTCSLEVDQAQLDSVGFVVDHFKGIAIKRPVNGRVKISQVCGNGSKLLWILGVSERTVQKTNVEEVCDPTAELEPQVVRRTTKLTQKEIRRMSVAVGIDWDRLGGLMGIPYAEREEIRLDCANYAKFSLKACQIFKLFNNRKDFCRCSLEKWLEELERHDLKREILPIGIENEAELLGLGTTPSQHEVTEALDTTPLSPREMLRLSLRIGVHWDILASLMDIKSVAKNVIRFNFSVYHDDCARAEKILSIFNRRESFSREYLARCLGEIGQVQWIEPIFLGTWRSRLLP